MGGPCHQKGHPQDYRGGRELRNLDQALIETAADIGRLNNIKFQLERDVDDLTRRIGESLDSTWIIK